MASITNELKFPTLVIPRGMHFHTADFVAKQINIAMCSTAKFPFIEKVDQKLTKDKEGKEFNVFIIHPNQSFSENAATNAVYSKLKDSGVVNISTGGQKGYFWKVKLYIPNLKAKFVPETKKNNAPRIMTDEDAEDFKLWREQRAAAKAAKAAKAAEKGPWESGDEEGEIREIDEKE
jgi:hypothetical protein